MKLIYSIFFFLLNFINVYSQSPKKKEMITLNGVNIYYEVYGKGKPLFLLHGFTQSSKSWRSFVEDYSSDFEVYLVDLKGHGKSSQFTENLSVKAAAKDLDALITHLKLENIHAIGFSYGGDILFQLALLHPGVITSMISIGACGTWKAKDFPNWIDYLSYKNIENLPWMKEEHTSEEQIRSILNQTINYDISISDDEMRSINTKTLFVLGDQDDSVPLECIANARKNLPNSFLWILPKTGHSAHTDRNKTEFVRVSKDFFYNKL